MVDDPMSISSSLGDYLVTVKLPRNPDHDPNNKVTGVCPAFGTYCTDVTGAHHTVLVRNIGSAVAARIEYELMGFHVTRIEHVGIR